MHLTLGILAWLATLAAAWGVWRWRLTEFMDRLTGRLGMGYFIALAVGGIGGAARKWPSADVSSFLKPNTKRY